jgi:glycosidase
MKPLIRSSLSRWIVLFVLGTMTCGLMCSRSGESQTGTAGEEGALLRRVTFRLRPENPSAKHIFLVGTFNDWDPSRTLLIDPDGDGIFEVEILLAPGTYEYKFVVDGKWFTDPEAESYLGAGREPNAVIRVDKRFPGAFFHLKDGEIYSQNIPLVLNYSMLNPLDKSAVIVRTLSNRNDVEKVSLLYRLESEALRSVDMNPLETDLVYQYWGTALDGLFFQPFRFVFQYTDGDTILYAAPGGFSGDLPAEAEWFSYDPVFYPPFTTPDWAKEGVFYQIFPDRFRNGDASNDPDFQESYYQGKTRLPTGGKTNKEYFHLIRDWNDIEGLKKSLYRTDGKPDYYSFYGGDIAGVMNKLPYLKDLGVTILYFNPLNQAVSNHKYDPVDYLKIDPHFADERTFREFVRMAHEEGIRIVVDMAFNHTGDEHFAFVDSRDKGMRSSYWDWYEWKKWPLPPEGAPTPCDYYDCWWGFPAHPNLNFDLSRPNHEENMIRDIHLARPNREVVEYILDVARYWIGDLGIDGFRLDVPNEVPLWFWKLFRETVEDLNPDAFLIGEIWGNAIPWLGPEGFHATMNYKYFRDPVLEFFGRESIDAAQFDRRLAPGRVLYPIQATRVMMNLIDSHDTERFLTMAGNREEKLKLAALFQMTYLGIPQIYYGDEVGLEGGRDPDNRRPFPWDWEKDKKRRSIHDYYRKIIHLRHQYPALGSGNFRTLLARDRVYAFFRSDERNRIIVVLNSGRDSASLTLDTDSYGFPLNELFREMLSGKEVCSENGGLHIELTPYTGAVLVPKGETIP